MNHKLARLSVLALPLLMAAPAFAQDSQSAPAPSATLPPASPPDNAPLSAGTRSHSANTVNALPPAGTSGDLSPADKAFVQKAAQGGIAEVELAQLAQQKTSNADVKQFAQKMIDDHTPNNEQLVKLASAKGLTPPSEPNVMQQKMLAHLQTLDGAKFDRAYINGQIKAHTMMEKMFSAEESKGKDSDLKGFAEQTLPVIEQHLSMAQQLNKSGV